VSPVAHNNFWSRDLQSYNIFTASDNENEGSLAASVPQLKYQRYFQKLQKKKNRRFMFI